MLPFRDVKAAFERNELYACFGTGTAAVIQPIGAIAYKVRRFRFTPGMLLGEIVLTSGQKLDGCAQLFFGLSLQGLTLVHFSHI
jgi:hypothetical protein